MNRVLHRALVVLIIAVVAVGVFKPLHSVRGQQPSSSPSTGKEGISGETVTQEIFKIEAKQITEHNSEDHKCGGRGCAGCNE